MVSWFLIVQLSACALTFNGSWNTGNRRLRGPTSSFIGELVWAWVFIDAKLWGALPLCAVLGLVHGRNLIKWYREGTEW